LPLVFALTALACGGPQAVESVTLTPETPALEAVLREADRRWEAAGVAPERIVIGPGGAPVRLVPERAPTAETRTRGRGGVYVGIRWMELHNLDVSMAMHEMGHAIGIGAASVVGHPIDDAECLPDAPSRPLMCPVGGTLITEIDLTLACEVAECVHFAPEA
jgi:hypothetical protein